MIKSKNILQQEEEFHKLNEEIDLKTKTLLAQVNTIKENQPSDEKPYSDWEKVDTLISDEIILEENLNEPKNENDLSEENFPVINYLSKLQCQDQDSNDVSSRKENVKPGPDDSFQTKRAAARRSVKMSQSAKLPSPLKTTTLGDVFAPPSGLVRHKSDFRLKEVSPDGNVIPETLKNVGNDGITRFLTAKVKLLTEQLMMMQKDEKKHLEKIKELQTLNEKLVGERDKMTQQANMARNVLVKYEQHTDNVRIQLQNTQTENGHLKKELETLKKEMREVTKSSNANEIKLNRTLEEVEKLKSTLQQMKQGEKELKEAHRKKVDELSTAVKKLDRQRADLLNGFKKQLLVIDNLKKQKELYEVSKILKNAEEDFINFLDCNPPKKRGGLTQ